MIKTSAEFDFKQINSTVRTLRDLVYNATFRREYRPFETEEVLEPLRRMGEAEATIYEYMAKNAENPNSYSTNPAYDKTADFLSMKVYDSPTRPDHSIRLFRLPERMITSHVLLTKARRSGLVSLDFKQMRELLYLNEYEENRLKRGEEKKELSNPKADISTQIMKLRRYFDLGEGREQEISGLATTTFDLEVHGNYVGAAATEEYLDFFRQHMGLHDFEGSFPAILIRQSSPDSRVDSSIPKRLGIVHPYSEKLRIRPIFAAAFNGTRTGAILPKFYTSDFDILLEKGCTVKFNQI